jgi:hypothetical protein
VAAVAALCASSILAASCMRAAAQTLTQSSALTLPIINVKGSHRAPRTGQVKPKRAIAAASSARPADAYDTGASNAAGGPPVPATMASQMTVSGRDLNARPVTRPGEILEAAAGLAVVMHADGGKANQYYLRGYNLDHGTDLAIFVDDMPINLPSHVHGQGYADLQWLIPETVSGLNIRKGPYFADVGDFATAGSLFINLRDAVGTNIASVTLGSFNYQRYLTMGSTPFGAGALLYAGEANFYDGPWVTPDRVHKFSGILRYSQGTATDGLSISAMVYDNKWTSTDQIPLRAIESGLISRYGEIDPTDGGATDRFSLSARMAQSDSAGSWKANAYIVRYGIDLFNNFTWFLTDPVNGDQFHQHEERIYGGAGVSRSMAGTFFGRPMETLIGFQARYDDISDALSNTVERRLLSTTLSDRISQGNVSM